LLHWLLVAQRLPQRPQLFGSLAVFTQLAPHAVPELHWQRPPLQDCPSPHRLPQLPQLFSSLVKSAQPLPHSLPELH
jgi:hypothetical protein